MPPSKALLQAVAVAAELTGTQLSAPAARVFAMDLARYPEDQVLSALDRCRRELRGRLTIADVLTRLQDGRPGPEEAWAMLPKDEAASCFWTDEMREASAVAQPLIDEGELIPARMAFLERYRALVQDARDAGRPVQWCFSPGADKSGRERVLLEAVEKGRLSAQHAQDLLPHHREDNALTARLEALASNAVKRIGVKAAA